MSHRWFFLVCVGVGSVFTWAHRAVAVDTRKIDAVRSKAVLDAPDFQVIDAFVRDAVAELTETRDFASIAELRSTIVTRARTDSSSAAAQYRRQFFDSAARYIVDALRKISELHEPGPKLVIKLNLLILVNQLHNSKLVEAALDYVDDENMAVRYWAVMCVTDPEIAAQMNSAENRQLAERIATRLGTIVETSSYEITELIATFAGNIDLPQAGQLLLRLADARITRYANWTVENEILDVEVLKALFKKATAGGADAGAFAARFGQLYSYAIQRYVRDAESGNFLSDGQRQQLLTVLVDVEQLCINKLLDRRQPAIKTAVERGDTQRLMQEHDALLGSEQARGALMLKLGADYGKKPDGSPRTAPLRLPAPPAPQG